MFTLGVYFLYFSVLPLSATLATLDSVHSAYFRCVIRYASRRCFEFELTDVIIIADERALRPAELK